MSCIFIISFIIAFFLPQTHAKVSQNSRKLKVVAV
jgi:hypothetical protein